MISQRSAPPDASPAAMPLEAFGRALARRRAALGEPELPRNPGNGRTPSKRALLKAIEKAGGTW